MNVGNPILAVTASIPPRITEAKEERDKLIARVLELNHEIATLETLRQVAPAILPDGEPNTQGQVPMSSRGKRERLDRPQSQPEEPSGSPERTS